MNDKGYKDMQPIILHLDMNSYFASVEQQDHLAWRGKPVGVCEHLGGIIIGASIEAKKWGIKTGTPVWEARRLYPKIILTKTHPDRYRLYTSRFVKVVSDYTAYVEKYSIDEVFLDITKQCNIKNPKSQIRNPKQILNLEQTDPWEEAASIAKIIKARMKKEVGDWLTCSVGIAENKLLAKIASDLKKPDGIIVISNAKLQISNEKPNSKFLILNLTKEELYQRLKLTDIPGIGGRQAKRLEEIGIRSLLDLKNCPYSLLVAQFGILGHHLYNMGQLKGSWKPKVEEDEKIKSIGHMYTLPQEFREKKFFVPVLYKLCEMVAKRMREQNLVGNVLHFYLRDKDYEGFGQSKKLGYFLNDGREIFLEAIRIFEQVMGERCPPGAGGKPMASPAEFKLIGVTISGLSPQINQQSLFARDERRKRMVRALDKVNGKYGDFTVCRVPILAARQVFHDSIGFGRLKEFSKWRREK